MSLDTARQRVAKGVELLDTWGPPNWRALIDITQLDMGDCSRCILGQLWGDFWDGQIAVQLRPDDDPGRYDRMQVMVATAEAGFDRGAPDTGDFNLADYEELQAAWLEVLQ